MEIISLNTSVFSMRKMHGATCIVAKLRHDHKIILELLCDQKAYS